jgi:hypothetical protein
MSRLLVHVGPTLPAAEVRQLAPSAEVQPPIEGGMLGCTQPRAGDVVVMIDGYYRDRPAVRHKEIMHLIHQGVRVVGAASMGALRAAELDGHGMVGVGRIYRMFKDGEICGDDEVAVRHGPAELGYRADSIALVNLRFGSQRAVAEGVVSPDTAAAVVAAAKDMVFDERTWPRITADLQGRLSDAGRAEVAALARYCSGRSCDLKAQDAKLAIEYSRGLLERGQSPVADPAANGQWPLWRTCYLREWVNFWESIEPAEAGDWISDSDVLAAARLYSPDYPDIHHEVLGCLLAEAASRQPSEPTTGQYVMGLLGLAADAPLPGHFRKRLSAAELLLPVAEQATLVAIRTWPTSICQDWCTRVVARLKSHPDWAQWRGLVLEANTVRASRTRQVQEIVAALLFLRRWGASGPAADRELGRRGFVTLTGLGQTATRFAPLEMPRRQAKSMAKQPL